MRVLALSDADRVYACSRSMRVTSRTVPHPEFGRFCLELKKLTRLLAENAEDDFWRPFLGRLRRYQFELCATLLPFNHPLIYSEEFLHLLHRQLSRCEMIFPDFAALARDLVERTVTLAELEDHPLMDVLTTLDAADGESVTALLLKDPRLIPQVETELSPYITPDQIEVINASQLRGGHCYGHIIVVGPSYWFPDHVFSAPRAEESVIVHYDWIRDRQRLEPVFVGSSVGRSTARLATDTGRQEDGRHSADADRYLRAEEMLPRADLEKVIERAVRHSRQDGGPETIPARLLLLEGGEAVFMESTEGATAYVIDLEDEAESRVKRVPVDNIEPGMFVLLRTQGGGDYIVPVADQILGKAATRYREMQRLWKSRLRAKVASSSISNVCTRLRRLGSRIAYESNVRNWMWERNIRTYYYEDFAAIMNLVGLEDRAQEFWNAMGIIDRAHRAAGFRIRKQLLEQVLNCDLTELERLGRMNFELAEAAGGTLTAFRVRDISSETVQVPYPRVNRPFGLGDELWRG